MIRYSLKCVSDHRFDSWFQNAAAFDALMGKHLVTCPECGIGEVQKTIMAPPIRTGNKAVAPAKPSLSAQESAPENERAKKLEKLRNTIESESEYVGMQFAQEARAMHDGDTPERAIYGEAKPAEAIKLLEDGVKVAPLPFIPRRKTN